MFAGYESLLITIALAGILAYSFYAVLLAGQLSLGQAGFASLGAYVSTLVVPETPLFGSLSPVLVGIPVGMAVGAFAAFLLGLPVLRLRGVFLAISTIAFSEVVRIFILNAEWTGGARGLRLDKWVTVDLAWIVLALIAYCFWRFGPSRTGRAFAAVREDEIAAQSMGINVARTRMISFVTSGAIAGLYGVMFAYFTRFIEPSNFDFSLMLDGLISAIVGGIALFIGPILAAAFFTPLPDIMSGMGVEAGWIPSFVAAAILLLVILFLPGGLSSLLTKLKPNRPVSVSAEPPELAPLPQAGSSLIELTGMSKHYGGVKAIDGVDLHLAAGEVLGIVGPNGAGKTTLINLVSGHVAPTSGQGSVLNTPLKAKTAVHSVAKAGLSRTFQHSKLFDRLSVLNNVLVGTHSLARSTFLRRLVWIPSARRDEAALKALAYRQLERVGLGDKAHLPAAQLSYGDQRRLEIARALASHPSVLILDEPAAGMNPSEATELAELIESIKNEGVAVILIEHRMSMVADLSDRIMVLDFGKVIADDEPDAVLNNEQVVEAYMGSADE
ncbi:ABC transporter permease subunit [Haloglycomyces albus]|uniref:branched-chain amino acid ABC transporter ATP-binding protein/permease n=1 Tax=Haloglycomyces albus TaxID=526067 RepID=UPI00046D5241|nr:branched-chain amino acid ABC transporter ATP-binding protein/permease [Haloglycomyces albus]